MGRNKMPDVAGSSRFLMTSPQDQQEALEAVRQRRLIIDRLDAWLFQEILPYLGQRVLEVGCGHGNLTRHLLDRELVVATDVDPASVNRVHEKFGRHHNLRVSVHDIAAPVTNELRALCVDTIVSINVFEHIEDDLQAFCNIANLLRTGGRVVTVVPAHDWLYGTMDASIGHYRRYTRRSISEKLQAAGLRVEVLYYLNVLGCLGWFVSGRLLRQTVPPVAQLRWFNQFVPLIAWLEHQIRPPFGLSLVCVASRPVSENSM
jgi:SAM-dependent methyltransferase